MFKVLILSFLIQPPDTASVLKSTSETLLNNIESSFNVNEYDLAQLLGEKVKLSNSSSFDSLAFDVIEQRFYIKLKKLYISTYIWYYEGKPFKVTCFLDDRIFDEPITQIETSIDESGVELLKENYRKLFYHSPDFSVLDPHPTIFSSMSRLGSACGAAGLPPELGNEMLIHLKNKDTNELIDWAKSFRPTQRVYGLIGLKVLEYDGVEEIQNSLLRDNLTVDFCSGCSVHETLSVAEFIQSEWMEGLVEDYKYLLER